MIPNSVKIENVKNDVTVKDLQDNKTDKENRIIGEGVKFDRIRRITGYLVGSLDRFNNAKRHEEHDRLKHGV